MADYYQRLYTFIQHSGMIPDSDEKNDEDIIGYCLPTHLTNS